MKNALFQIHWFLGITAGVVLALMGITGAMMSFEKDIMDAISPDIIRVEQQGTRLSPDEFVARFEAKHPELRIEQLSFWPEDDRSIQVRLQPNPGERRGAAVYADPYTADNLGAIRGEGFFKTVRALHRWLLIPYEPDGLNLGRQITGFCTIALIFFCLSGLYLRWPRRALNWRNWFRIDFSLKGRNFYWALHSVIGTWLIVVYLLLALTGLSWSYVWYKNGLSIVLTGESIQQQSRGPGGPGGRGPGGPRGPGEGGGMDAPTFGVYGNALSGALQAVGDNYKVISLTRPKVENDPIAVSYVPAGVRSDRRRGNLSVSPEGEVLSHTPYAPVQPLGKRINQSMFELHTGEFFGTPGVIVNMIASILMPLFTITGFLLYFDRRRKKRSSKAAAAAVTRHHADADYWVVYASQTGSAEQLAWHTATVLQSAGHTACVKSIATLDGASLASAKKMLFIVSTFGEGEAPDSARSFARKWLASPLALDHLEYAVMGLGDSRYADYCAFATRVEAWLKASGAKAIFSRIDVDNGNTGALDQWWQCVANDSGATTVAAWAAAEFDQWILVSRTCLNSGSQGAPIYSVSLAPQKASQAHWQAGDILEIKPRHAPQIISALLGEAKRDASELVQGVPLAEWLAQHELPSSDELALDDWRDRVSALKPLTHREYSIASITTQGALTLVVRQMFGDDGRLGLGSGWLTEHASLNSVIDARIRSNNGFHAPDDQVPMILIGAGTGIAGIRSHLHQRYVRDGNQHWLIFGERNRAFDRLFGQEIDNWSASGFLTEVDEVYSRDGDGYVQAVLTAKSAQVREWLARGATIYVCGSVEMGEGVQQALLALIGESGVNQLIEQGRYRRDIY